LKSNGWFEGGHSVNLNHAGERSEITTEADLVAAIEAEKERLLRIQSLQKCFRKLTAS
jgi:hypothetical protein